ncbi:THO complex subunit 1 isoform X2 [Arachis duranensis]|uniref:THO complex subunit 1 isoform X2 n=1 Tax=Arachis duranensis TaxID=130453 RepID=A0A6P4D5U3_ARADU|nr:THO complex subunit 1 isoform X2 [Arachis duranensis]XP_057729088.1 THO complex subunit 1 isoform X2 [Arachis stenosperma]
MEVFKRAIMQPGPPEHFALLTVQEVIKPQKQTKLAQDENQLLENILRMLLQEYVSSAVQSGEKIMHFGQSIDATETTQGLIPRLLDIVLYLCEKEHIEGGMIFSLLEDLTEMSTMKNCKDIFGYIESKQDILGKQELFARGKLVMLRTCNQLLRRLSKEYFSNPTITHAPSKWQKFASSLSVVLNTFEAQPLSDEEGDANNLEEEAVNFSIKYLTSSKLMGLELKDPSFRRHVLVQCLILFDYLKAPGKGDKDLPSESMKDEISSCEARVKRLLELTPPKGKEFLHKIEHILEREKNWVWWKRDGCLPYEKQPTEKKAIQDGTKKRKPRWRLGNKELSQLWKWADQNPNALTNPQRVQTPSIMDYWKPLAEDMDPSAGIEAEYHHKNNRVYCWKGLRLSARQDLEGFSKFTDHGVEGVVPLELLPPDVRSKYQAKPNERGKRSKKEEAKGTAHQVDENQMSTHATEVDVEGIRTDMTATPMEFDAASIPGAQGETPTPEELQKQSSDTDGGQEAGQLDADAEVEAGIIDGETDADVDLDAKDD